MNHVRNVRLCLRALSLFSFLGALCVLSASAVAQVEVRWMFVGSMRGFYVGQGCEWEEVRGQDQQDGLEWPAYYQYQDCQAAKGFWIGCQNYTDQNGKPWDQKIVHVGPRVQGVGEMFPMEFYTVSKFEPPVVTVDGNVSTSGRPVNNTAVDPTLPCDRMIVNKVNTAIGMSMTRKILGFSQGYHDNYLVYEYTFTNTGNINADPAIELPNQTLTGVYFFWQYRYSVCKESGYVIGNNSRWGINTMNDVRGDGLNPNPTFFPGNQDNDIRASYAWQGKYFLPCNQGGAPYDNIGASVWYPPQSSGEPFSDRTDTSGRLCAPQFVGVAALHVDRSTSDRSDDPSQPSTTTYIYSNDAQLTYNQDFTNTGKMAVEYSAMSFGHMDPRHADKVGPTGDPSQGFTTTSSDAGQSCATGYGPFTIGPGDSIRIVMVEAMAGLSREKCISVGTRYKMGTKYNVPYPDGINSAQKNDSVYTGRDSLFQTFRRAIANYNSGYSIPMAPYPPRTFDVISSGDKVSLAWTTYGGGPTVTAWRVYRAVGRSDGIYTQIAEVPGSATSYDDPASGLSRGVAYYYYVIAVGDPAENNGAGSTPAGVALVSNRAYSQSYDPAYLKRAPGVPSNPSSMDSIRIVPNPYSISAYMNKDDPYSLRFPGEKDKIAFLNIPGYCTISIYTELGELINTIDHNDGSGDEYWNSITSSNQVIVSGVYIVVFENQKTGEKRMQKLIIVR
jgi:hypothetical protein